MAARPCVLLLFVPLSNGFVDGSLDNKINLVVNESFRICELVPFILIALTRYVDSLCYSQLGISVGNNRLSLES